LEHMEGYRGSKPVRIGNGAAFHVQLDIYGELMDGIYLANRLGKPITYDQWLSVREIADYVCSIWQEKDMSIWEVRTAPLQSKQRYAHGGDDVYLYMANRILCIGSRHEAELRVQ
jgi:GH15 family glucan-1,4-alpha-glucosidase